ncbi:MAG TPA: SGNH/GDSL hydrolase family protein [Kiritimatiellia bacterium]|nr:SGNH/GDSL hydrolase family protein [Kiritimatiellia bacterium]
MEAPAATSPFRRIGVLLLTGFLAGCGDEGGGLSNGNPGLNDVNVVAAFGDSITQGNMCSCAPYPARLGPLVGKTVVNAGVHGTMARESVGRAQTVIDRFHPAFMLILYGVNDGIHGKGTDGTLAALRDMVGICRQNQVVPVLATYPLPFGSHGAFTGRTDVLNDGIRALAKELRVRCVDLEREFAGPADPVTGLAETDRSLMETDGLHPNDAGTQIMALAFADLF